VPGATRRGGTVYRLEAEILHFDLDFLCLVGSGSTIDTAKAANTLSCLGRVTNDPEDYFGVSRVSAIAEKAGLIHPEWTDSGFENIIGIGNFTRTTTVRRT